MNAQVTHTPGPWNCHFHDIETTLRPGTFRINMSGAVTAGVWSSGALRDEVEATARLIAAAPLMLDVLCDLRDRIHACAPHPLSMHEVFDSTYVSVIEEAIASATGAKA